MVNFRYTKLKRLPTTALKCHYQKAGSENLFEGLYSLSFILTLLLHNYVSILSYHLTKINLFNNLLDFFIKCDIIYKFITIIKFLEEK